MPSVSTNRAPQAVVITGLGVVSPIGTGRSAFGSAIEQGQSGIRPLSFETALDIKIGGEVRDFDPKQYVRPRKSLKVMSREIQFAFTAADLAMVDAGLTPEKYDPQRLGVVFGSEMIYCELEELVDAYRACMPHGTFDFSRWQSHAMGQMFPLWMLKYLPNMPACHVAIAHDARGACNSVVLGDASSLAAISEGCRVIERGHADCMIVGGVSNRLHPTCLTFRSIQPYTKWRGEPQSAMRPFDAARTGVVPGEGAAAFVIESLDHAMARGANILARVLGTSSRFEPQRDSQPLQGTAIRAAITSALAAADLAPNQVGHVNAHGLGTIDHDQVEARSIRAVLGDVPVTAPKSFFGNLGAGSGAVEMAATVLCLSQGKIPLTLNYEQPDPECPVNVVAQAQRFEHPTAVVLSQSTTGQSLAVVLAAE